MLDRLPALRLGQRKSSLLRLGSNIRQSLGGSPRQSNHSTASTGSDFETTGETAGTTNNRPHAASAESFSPRRRTSSFSGARLASFELKLEATLLNNAACKSELLAAAKKQFAEESLLLYEALRKWEDDNKASVKKRLQEAKSIVANYIEPGSKHENGCISAATRADLMELLSSAEATSSSPATDLFAFVKQEVLSDIYLNAAIKALVEQLHERISSTSTPS